MTHYENKLTHPPVGSRFEFYVYAFSLLTHYPPFPLSWDPVDLPPELSPRDRRILTTLNREAAKNAEHFKSIATKHLLSRGLREEMLSEPWVQDSIASLARELRAAADDMQGRQEAPAPLEAPYSKVICQRVVYVASDVLNPGLNALAKILNEGKARNSTSVINEDHVLRAKKAYLETYRRDPGNRCAGLASLDWHHLTIRKTFKTVEAVRASATEHTAFHGLRGAELAQAIEEKCGLISCVDWFYRNSDWPWIENEYARDLRDIHGSALLQLTRDVAA